MIRILVIIQSFFCQELRAKETSLMVCGLMLISQMSKKFTALNEVCTTLEGTSSFDYFMLVPNSEMVLLQTLSFEHFATSFTG